MSNPFFTGRGELKKNSGKKRGFFGSGKNKEGKSKFVQGVSAITSAVSQGADVDGSIAPNIDIMGLKKIAGSLLNLYSFSQKFEKSLRQAAASSGLIESNFDLIRESVFEAQEVANFFGVSLDKLIDSQKEFFNVTGRQRILSKDDLENIVIMNRALGRGADKLQETTKFAAQMSKFGMDIGDVVEFSAELVETASSMGVSLEGVIDSVTKNIERASKLGFKNGIRDLITMTTQAEKLRFNLDSAFTVAEQKRDIESVLTLTSELGVLGQNIDPFSFLYKTREDVAGLQGDLVQMMDEFVQFDPSKGGLAMTSVGRDIAKRTAEQLGIGFDEFAKSAFQKKKLGIIDQMLGGADISPEQRQILSMFGDIGTDEFGQMEFTVAYDGQTLGLDEVVNNQKILQDLQDRAAKQKELEGKSEKELMEEQAMATMNLSETLVGLTNVIKNELVKAMNMLNQNVSRPGVMSMTGDGLGWVRSIEGMADGIGELVDGQKEFSSDIFEKISDLFTDKNKQIKKASPQTRLGGATSSTKTFEETVGETGKQGVGAGAISSRGGDDTGTGSGTESKDIYINNVIEVDGQTLAQVVKRVTDANTHGGPQVDYA